MNGYNNNSGAKLIGDENNLFDFEAASSNPPEPSIHDSLVGPVQTAHSGELTHSMLLTKSEIEAIVAMRASNAQSSRDSNSLVPLELNTNFLGFEEPCAYGARFNYDDAEIPTSANLSDFDMHDYGNPPPNKLDSSETFKQPQFEELGDVFGALLDNAPNPADQLR
jgi:hypothetical protein